VRSFSHGIHQHFQRPLYFVDLLRLSVTIKCNTGFIAMPFYFYAWTDEIIEHLAEHGVEIAHFEAIVGDAVHVTKSRSSDRLMAFGYTDDGRYLACVYDLLDDEMTIVPVTAYEPD
jgi:uncharacterized DUF497 family protein